MTLRHLAILLGLSISSHVSAQTPTPTPPQDASPAATPTLEESVATPADPEPTATATNAEPSQVEKMTMGARKAARDGRCDAVAIIGNRVREQDDRYYAEVFAVDPVIVACVQGRRVALALPVTVAPPSMVPDTSSSTVASVDELPMVHGDDYKSPSTALAVSFGVTGAGILMAIAAGNTDDNDMAATLGITGAAMIIVGPTTGHIYAGNGWNTGLKWRLATLGVVVGAGLGALVACPPLSQSCNDAAAAPLVGIGAGAAVTHVGATLYELATAGASARAYNRKRHPDLAVAPLVGREPGVALVGRF